MTEQENTSICKVSQPQGEFNQPKDETKPIEQAKRGRGRPKGSKNKRR